MEIGIVGQGYVGTAVKVVFEKFYNVYTHDINKEICNCSSLEDLVNKTNIIFIFTKFKKYASCF